MTTVDVSIKGHAWEILTATPQEDRRLERHDGYTDWTVRRIVIREQKPEPDFLQDMTAYQKKVLRHEIIHAFFFECGLGECSHEAAAFAKDEEMVDWWAFNGPEVYKVWQAAGAL